MTNLDLIDKMPFGKYKGQVIQDVYKKDAAYLVWLREERKKSNSDEKFFSAAVSQLLDMTIRDSKPLRAKYTPWNLPVDAAVRTEPVAQEREPELSYNGYWGNF